MDETQLHSAIEAVARRDAQVAAALSDVGFPDARQADPGFASLVRILVGQQLSVKAAASIHGRFEAVLNGKVTPQSLLSADPAALRGAGLSNAKVRYTRAAADAIAAGTLDLGAVAQMDEQAAMRTLTAVTGIGPWTAHIYLLFCEGREDVWPAGDMALQEALRRLKALKERPSAKETVPLVQPWAPWRGAMAVFLWHYYAASEAPV